jgi:FkbM family methyltransferase
VRGWLEAKGYWIRHRSVLPFGIDYQNDIDRLAKLLELPISVFFDVGANVGQSTVAALEKFPNATIFSFEPDDRSFAALTTRVRDKRVRPFNVALSDQNGEAQFFDYGELATSNSLVPDAQYATRALNEATIRMVKCETLDDLCARLAIDRIDVLKIDAEGHDLAVLHGARRMLAEQRVGFVYIEFNTLLPKSDATGGALLPISELLEPAGFKFVASYPEYMITTGELFVTSNALFVHQAR